MEKNKEELRCEEINPETGEKCILPKGHEGLHKSNYTYTDHNGFKYEFSEDWELIEGGKKIVYPIRNINLRQIIDPIRKQLFSPEEKMKREREFFRGGWKSFINMAIREIAYDIDPNKLAKDELINILTKYILTMERKTKEWEENYQEDPHLGEYIHTFRQEATIASIELSRLQSEDSGAEGDRG